MPAAAQLPGLGAEARMSNRRSCLFFGDFDGDGSRLCRRVRRREPGICRFLKAFDGQDGAPFTTTVWPISSRETSLQCENRIRTSLRCSAIASGQDENRRRARAEPRGGFDQFDAILLSSSAMRRNVARSLFSEEQGYARRSGRRSPMNSKGWRRTDRSHPVARPCAAPTFHLGPKLSPNNAATSNRFSHCKEVSRLEIGQTVS